MQQVFHFIPVYILPVHNSFWEANKYTSKKLTSVFRLLPLTSCYQDFIFLWLQNHIVFYISHNWLEPWPYEQTSRASDCVFVQFWWMWMLTNGSFLLGCDLLIKKPWFMRSNWHSETKESENKKAALKSKAKVTQCASAWLNTYLQSFYKVAKQHVVIGVELWKWICQTGAIQPSESNVCLTLFCTSHCIFHMPFKTSLVLLFLSVPF